MSARPGGFGGTGVQAGGQAPTRGGDMLTDHADALLTDDEGNVLTVTDVVFGWVGGPAGQPGPVTRAGGFGGAQVRAGGRR